MTPERQSSANYPRWIGLGVALIGFPVIFYQAVSKESPSAYPTQQPAAIADTLDRAIRFGFGRPATDAEIRRLDIDVRPDGVGLPAGLGSVKAGKQIYGAKCAACHGINGEGPTNRLVATSFTAREKAIGNYWPYATTLFDYIRRAMPFNAPGSLTNEEVYSLTAYLLAANKIIDSTAVIDARTLPKVVMPAQKLFVPDDRRGGREVR